MPRGTGGSNPSLSAKYGDMPRGMSSYLTETDLKILPHDLFCRRHAWRSTQAAVRGSPAKGVDWVYRCEGSNPSFSAIFVHHRAGKDHPRGWSFCFSISIISSLSMKRRPSERMVQSVKEPRFHFLKTGFFDRLAAVQSTAASKGFLRGLSIERDFQGQHPLAVCSPRNVRYN